MTSRLVKDKPETRPIIADDFCTTSLFHLATEQFKPTTLCVFVIDPMCRLLTTSAPWRPPLASPKFFLCDPNAETSSYCYTSTEWFSDMPILISGYHQQGRIKAQAMAYRARSLRGPTLSKVKEMCRHIAMVCLTKRVKKMFWIVTWPISHRFKDKRRFPSKIANFSHPRFAVIELS